MDVWTDIRRRVLVEGESIRSIQREYGFHFQTIKKVLGHAAPPGYRLSRPRGRPKIQPFLPVIHEILKQDKQAPRKQRHTAKRIFVRLKEEHGFQGGYTIVKDVVRALRLKQREVFVPLSHRPGEAQVDFGQAEVIEDDGPRKAALFVMSLPYSDAVFVQLYPKECMEAFLDGHVRAFAFFGGVPRRISYDNTKLAVAKIIGGRGRQITRGFQRLVSHYLFETHFCRVRRANEKGHVENLVGYGRRNFLVPVPRVARYDAFNEHLVEQCRKELSRHLRGKSATKGELLEEERSAFLPWPKQGFKARRVVSTRANSLSLVRFDGNDYSVPTAHAYHRVTVVGAIDEVRLVAGDRVVARHRRIWDKERVCFDPIHYLALLERKPGAFDFARPLEDWDLPEVFTVLRGRLEADFGHEGTRDFIKVLRLLERFSLRELTRAVEKALAIDVLDVEAVRLILEGLRERPAALFRLDGRPHLSHVRVQAPDLASYAALTAPAGGGV